MEAYLVAPVTILAGRDLLILITWASGEASDEPAYESSLA